MEKIMEKPEEGVRERIEAIDKRLEFLKMRLEEQGKKVGILKEEMLEAEERLRDVLGRLKKKLEEKGDKQKEINEIIERNPLNPKVEEFVSERKRIEEEIAELEEELKEMRDFRGRSRL